jgi:hypothetical protein
MTSDLIPMGWVEAPFDLPRGANYPQTLLTTELGEEADSQVECRLPQCTQLLVNVPSRDSRPAVQDSEHAPLKRCRVLGSAKLLWT